MTTDAKPSLHNESRTNRLLVAFQLGAVSLRMSHAFFPARGRLLAVANLFDAITLAIAPTGDDLSNVHQAVATTLSQQKAEQVQRSVDVIEPMLKSIDDLDFNPSK
jgi:hypothetical protein